MRNLPFFFIFNMKFELSNLIEEKILLQENLMLFDFPFFRQVCGFFFFICPILNNLRGLSFISPYNQV